VSADPADRFLQTRWRVIDQAAVQMITIDRISDGGGTLTLYVRGGQLDHQVDADDLGSQAKWPEDHEANIEAKLQALIERWKAIRLAVTA
jgi:hypothetical protein